MSHPACLAQPEGPGAPSAGPSPPSDTEEASRHARAPLVASYDCINDCASSLGVASLVSGAVAGLGCYALPPACPAFIAAVPATILQACDSACRELESR
jgi:hypothetical protein